MKVKPNQNSQFSRRDFIRTATLSTVSVVIYGCIKENQPLIEIFNSPKRFTRRHGELTANICGSLSSQVKNARYSLNEGSWVAIAQGRPRTPAPIFTIELKAEDLLEGINQLKIEAISTQEVSEIETLEFEYNSSDISLPIICDWSKEEDILDIQDGLWERYQLDNQWRVRPKPGFEEYDRILNVTGAFPGGRRVETEMIFRRNIWWMEGGFRDYGFGVLSMWGGHPDEPLFRPRRGWRFGLSLYWKPIDSLRLEFSEKYGDAQPINKYSPKQDFEPKGGMRYFVVIESLPVQDKLGNHLYYQQRTKWWQEGQREPDTWMEVDSLKEGKSMIPEGEYAVALLAHRAQVDFGAVKITPLEPLVVN
ncbi:MAG: hypothetical protein QNJ74_14865 [Trichodesmium sp. MO_231.B1]|nr:hypothetical protein [Trichodesmium sp. MO_231.B1]